MDMCREEVEIGMILYLISKFDDPTPLPTPKESDAEAGWRYLNTVIGQSDEISFDAFEVQVGKVINRGIFEFGVKEKILSLLNRFVGKYSVPSENVQTLPAEIAEKFVNWLTKFSPLLSSAIFCLFGANS